jgi:hypothetical protein
MTISAFVLMLSLTEVNAQIINNNTSAGSGVDGEKTAEEYDLTDKDRFESQVFVHDGLNNRQIQEECEKLKDSRACQGRGGTKFLGIDSGMVQAVSKVYSMFGAVMGASGGGGFSAPKAEAPAEGATETATEGQAIAGESEGKQDY